MFNHEFLLLLRYTVNFPPDNVVDVPIVTQEKYLLLRLDEHGRVEAMSEAEEVNTFEMPPGKLGNRIRLSLQESGADIKVGQ